MSAKTPSFMFPFSNSNHIFALPLFVHFTSLFHFTILLLFFLIFFLFLFFFLPSLVLQFPPQLFSYFSHFFLFILLPSIRFLVLICLMRSSIATRLQMNKLLKETLVQNKLVQKLMKIFYPKMEPSRKWDQLNAKASFEDLSTNKHKHNEI